MTKTRTRTDGPVVAYTFRNTPKATVDELRLLLALVLQRGTGEFQTMQEIAAAALTRGTKVLRQELTGHD